MKRLWLLSVLFLAPGVSSCGCNLILNVYTEPKTVVLSVGETASPPSVSTQFCFEPRQRVEITAWESRNSEIASVDPATGVITGVAPGETNVIAFAEGDSRDTFYIPVTLVAPTAIR